MGTALIPAHRWGGYSIEESSRGVTAVKISVIHLDLLSRGRAKAKVKGGEVKLQGDQTFVNILTPHFFSGLGGPITKSFDVVIAECGRFF